jgi:LCP family protein required for cell wall assembly
MSPNKLKRKIFSHPRFTQLLILGGVFVLIGVVFRFLLYPVAPEIFDFGKNAIFNSQSFSLQSDNGRTNVLLMGIGGENHDGPDLTDTMIVVSVVTKLSKDQILPPPIALISIPRDIYINSIENKINAAYTLGKEKGAPLTLPKQLVSEITGLPIHYAAVVDFSVFEKIVDRLGGIDVKAPTAFDDPEYPVSGKENDLCDGDVELKCRYETLHFDAGWQHMSGARALQFVRSRKGTNDEGTDFARSRRQQLVIAAIRDKTFSLPNLMNISVGLQIYNDLKANIDTDFDFSNPNELLRLALNYRQAKFKNLVLDGNQLESPLEDYRGWILLPIGGNWDQVHKFIATESSQLQP